MQYLKKLGLEFMVCMQIEYRLKFLEVGIIVFDVSGGTCPKYSKVFYIVIQDIQIFYRGSVRVVVTWL